MDAQALYEKIISSLSKILDETLRSYYTDRDRSRIRNINWESSLEKLKTSAENKQRVFMSMLERIKSKAIIKTQDVASLILKAQEINNDCMPKGHNCPPGITKNGNPVPGDLFMLDDKSWELKEDIYKIKYDIIEQILILLRDNREIDITAVLKPDADLAVRKPRVLAFYLHGDKKNCIAQFHMPTMLEDYITNKYPIVYSRGMEKLPLKPVEDKRIVIKDGTAWIDTHEEDLAKLRKQKEQEANQKAKDEKRRAAEMLAAKNGEAKRQDKIEWLKKSRMLVPITAGDYDSACIIKIKRKGGGWFYNAVPDAARYDVPLVLDKNHQPVEFDDYKIEDGDAQLTAAANYAWVSSDGQFILD